MSKPDHRCQPSVMHQAKSINIQHASALPLQPDFPRDHFFIEQN